MSKGRDGKKGAPEFGKRGRETVEQAERKPTALQRMKTAGGRWWGIMQPKKKKDPRVFGFKRSRLGL